MKTSEAIKHAYRMHEMWISCSEIRNGKGYDLDRIHRSMLDEWRYQRSLPHRQRLAKEIMGDLILLGKVRRALA